MSSAIDDGASGRPRRSRRLRRPLALCVSSGSTSERSGSAWPCRTRPARVATPLAVIDARKALGDGRELVRLVEDYEVELLVAGLPLSLDGSEGPQAARVRSAPSDSPGFVALPLEFADERLSSTAARRAMTEAGVSDRDKRGSVDMVAASIFLQSLPRRAPETRRGVNAMSDASSRMPVEGRRSTRRAAGTIMLGGARRVGGCWSAYSCSARG